MTDRRKTSLYFPNSIIVQIEQEALRLDRSHSWVVQTAWKIALATIRQLPSQRPT